MSDCTTTRRRSLAALFAAFCLFAGARPAQAQGFISPFIGYNFGGDAGCPEITNCEDKRTDYGVSFGALGSIVGFEAELGYTKNFFGETSSQTSNVLTFMGNFMLAPKIGPVRPYLATGVGLIKTHTEFTTSSILTTDNNSFGWDIGGGLHVTVAPHVGVRGDIRYFHTFQDLTGPFGFSFGTSNQKLDYGRAAAAVDFTF